MSDENLLCPKCGTSISRDDKFCKNCGASLGVASSQKEAEPAPKAEERYERKLSAAQRFTKLLTSPSEAMQDIALAPEYLEISVVIVSEFILTLATLAVVMQKIQIQGQYASTISGMLLLALSVGAVLAIGIYVAMWLGKSLLAKAACDSGSKWNFETAACITGYAYVPDIIVTILNIIAMAAIMPTFIVDTSNLEASRAALSTFTSQAKWLRLVYSLPLSVLSLFWKSYLGGLGTHFGTRKRCSIRMGFIVFLMLGLVGLLISFISY